MKSIFCGIHCLCGFFSFEIIFFFNFLYSILFYFFCVSTAGTPPPAYQPHDDNANMNNQNRNNHPRPHHTPMDTLPTPSHGNRVAGKLRYIFNFTKMLQHWLTCLYHICLLVLLTKSQSNHIIRFETF